MSDTQRSYRDQFAEHGEVIPPEYVKHCELCRRENVASLPLDRWKAITGYQEPQPEPEPPKAG